MISKQYFEETFSLATAQALQTWANNNLIIQGFGDYAMRVGYTASSGSLMFAETELSGLTIDKEYTVRIYMQDILSNAFRVFINSLPSDNSSVVLQLGWVSTPGWIEGIFTATAETMYLAIGDDSPASSTYSVSDNITVKDTAGINYVTNGTFEGNNTTGWYGQDANTDISVYSYVVDPPIVDNPYLEPVNIPAYDAGNSAHQLISSDTDWNSINGTSKTNFYVEPGDYSALGQIQLTTSGTASTKRTISLLNGNDTHPGKLDYTNFTDTANVRLDINADYWVVDRMVTVETSYNSVCPIELQYGASNNIINRYFAQGTNYAVRLLNGNNNDNTVQQCRFQELYDSGSDGNVAVELVSYNGFTDTFEMRNFKCISNEFYNCNDGFQTVILYSGTSSGDDIQDGSAPGLIVYDNDFQQNKEFMENGIDLKFGSKESANPMLIENNRFWGWKQREGWTPGGYGPGTNPIGCHFSVRNTNIVNNFFWDSADAIDAGSGSGISGYSYGLVDSTVEGNLFYMCGIPDEFTYYKTRYPVKCNNAENTQMDNNVFIDCTLPPDIGGFHYCYNGTTFGNNDIVNSPYSYEWTHGDSGGDTTFMNSLASNIDNSANSSVAVGYTEDYVITVDKYTNSPYVITLPNVLKP